MSITRPSAPGTSTGTARRIPPHRLLPGLLRDPMETFTRVGVDAAGAVVRLDLGLTRPFLATHPDDVAHVLVGRPDNYPRAGMLWDPLARLIGTGLGGEGEPHARSRRLVAPLFAARQITGLVPGMAQAASEAIAGWPRPPSPAGLRAGPDSGEGGGDPAAPGAGHPPAPGPGHAAGAGHPPAPGPGHAAGTPPERGRGSAPALDLTTAMTRVVSRVIIRTFFGSRISPDDSDRLGAAIDTAFTSLGARMLLPFVPARVPLPGTAAFARAVRDVDAVAYPLIEQARRDGADGGDIVSLLCHARDADGAGLDDRQVRDDLVAMYVAGSETTSVALTWLWVMLHRHREVAARVRAEVDRLPDRAPAAGDLPALRYTRQVLQELLRLYPTGWLIPRTVREDDVLGGVRVPAGATVLLSPYLTHRMPQWWQRPDVFDPDRFAGGRAPVAHRFAYFPFGGGPHQCLGSNVFTVAGQLVVATVLRRFHVDVVDADSARPGASVTLRPRRPVLARLRPAGGG